MKTLRSLKVCDYSFFVNHFRQHLLASLEVELKILPKSPQTRIFRINIKPTSSKDTKGNNTLSLKIFMLYLCFEDHSQITEIVDQDQLKSLIFKCFIVAGSTSLNLQVSF